MKKSKKIKKNKVVKKSVKKPKIKKFQQRKLKKYLQKEESLRQKAEKLIAKGKERGFVTYDEILKEFPNIETDVFFLDEFYGKLSSAGLDVLEGGGLLETKEEEVKKYAYGGRAPDAAYDSIQIYLKEIGQYPLISASMEKELARKILAGDDEAKGLLVKANLRLVVSIAKKYVGRKRRFDPSRPYSRRKSRFV
jgi:RNA polymerase primary sigma factor